MNRLEESRRRVEARMADARESIEAELGFAPRAMGVLMMVAAFSVGMVVAGRIAGGRSPERGLEE